MINIYTQFIIQIIRIWINSMSTGYSVMKYADDNCLKKGIKAKSFINLYSYYVLICWSVLSFFCLMNADLAFA